MGALTYGETVGKAEIAGSLVTVCKLEKSMIIGIAAAVANNLVLVAMDVV